MKMISTEPYKPNLGTTCSDLFYILDNFPLLKNIPHNQYYGGRLFLNIDPTMDTEWGYCMSAADSQCPLKFALWEIGLAGEFPSRRKYLDTLVHELFHLYQMTVLKLPIPNHGRRMTTYMATTAKRELDKMLRKER